MMLQFLSGAITTCGATRPTARPARQLNSCQSTRDPHCPKPRARRARPPRIAPAQLIDARGSGAPDANTARASASSIIRATAASLMETFERHRHAAEAQNAEQQHHHLQAVVHEHGDPIPGLSPAPLSRWPRAPSRARTARHVRRRSPSISAARAPAIFRGSATRSGAAAAGAWNQVMRRRAPLEVVLGRAPVRCAAVHRSRSG